MDFDETGVNAVEFIINHAEVSLVFVQEKTLSSVSHFLYRNQSYYKFHFTFLVLQEICFCLFFFSYLCLKASVQVLASHKGCSSNLKSKLHIISFKSMIRCIFRFYDFSNWLKFFCLDIFLVSAIVSFGEVSTTQKEEAKKQCVSLFSWHEFSLMVSVISYS